MKPQTILLGAVLVGAGLLAANSYAETETPKKGGGGGGGGSGGGGGGGGGGLTDEPDEPEPEATDDPYNLLDPDQGARLQDLCDRIGCCTEEFLTGFAGLLSRLQTGRTYDEFVPVAETELARLENIAEGICDWGPDETADYFADPDAAWQAVDELAKQATASSDPIEIGWVLRQLLGIGPNLPQTAAVKDKFARVYPGWVSARCSAWRTNMTAAIKSGDPSAAQRVLGDANAQLTTALNNVGGLMPGSDAKLQGCFSAILAEAEAANWPEAGR